MHTTVVGAGIAGLSAAIALRRAGHTVSVYEKSRFKNEIGAAVAVTPNGNRVLREWDFDFDEAGAVEFRFLNGSTLQPAYQDRFTDIEASYGDHFCAFHRVDLHAGLRKIAEEKGGEKGWGPPVKIHLGAEVTGLDVEDGVVRLADAREVKSDFVVLADGVHCKFLADVTGENTPLMKIGKAVYRWLVPIEKVMEEPESKRLWDGQENGHCWFFDKKGVFIVTYPCRNNTLLNCAVFHTTLPSEVDKLDWNSFSAHEDVLSALSDFDPAVRSLVTMSSEIKVYTVTQRPPPAKLWAGRVVAIGDAAHHMLPIHGQGAAAAFEDAAALEIFFATSSLPTPSDARFKLQLQKKLELYQILRLPRSATTQVLSSCNPRLTMEGLAAKHALIKKFYDGEVVEYPLACNAWSKPVREFLWGYDVKNEARKLLGLVEKWEGKSGIVGIHEQARGELKWFGEVIEGDGGGLV